MSRGEGRRYRREWLMTALSALLFVYMMGLLLRTVAWGVAYSTPQWVLIGVMVTGSAVLLAWQIRRLVRLRRAREGRRDR